MDRLPESERPAVKAQLRRAWAEAEYDRALEQLKRLAADLERTHSSAAGSLREGMETLTVTRLGPPPKLHGARTTSRSGQRRGPSESGVHANVVNAIR